MMMAEKPSSKSKEKPMVSSRLPKVFAICGRTNNPPPAPSEYKQTTDLLSPLKVTKPEYERMQRLFIQADSQPTLVNIVPIAPLKLTDFVVITLINTSFIGSVKKMLHAPTMKMYAVRVLAITNREMRTNLADWLRTWTLLQEGCEQLVQIEMTSWNQPEGHVSIALEYANSGSLQSLLDSLGAVPERIIWSISKQVTEALKFLHSKGLIHGQICASQVLLCRNGKVKLDMAAKSHLGAKVVQQSPYEHLGKGTDQSQEEDIFDLGTTLLECAIGGAEWLECLNSSVQQNCCVYHTISQAGVAPLLTRCSSAFKSFLCECLRFNPARRMKATELMNHEWLAQKETEAGVKVTLSDLLSVSFQWGAPHEYRVAAEKQLDRICESLKMVLMRSKPRLQQREPISELALDLGLEEAAVVDKLSSVYCL